MARDLFIATATETHCLGALGMDGAEQQLAGEDLDDQTIVRELVSL